ncbi:MAG: hypothetical protein AB1758_21080 [Candidatus Eremiobacterota bacterium]
MQTANVPSERHLILQENLASYLVEMPDAYLDRLESASPDTLNGRIRSGYAWGQKRWVDKVLRDLEKPYTDAQVAERVEELDADLKRLARELMEHAGRRIYVTGSILQGRLGAHSDLDVVCESEAYRPTAASSGVSAQHVGTASLDFYLRSFGTYASVDPAEVLQRDVVAALWESRLEAKGFQVERQAGRWNIQRHQVPERRPEPKAERTGMIWDFSDLPA